MEALVAISIIMVAVTSPITIAQKGLSSAVYSKDQMIASYLAQDAIEYIKNIRDENVLNSRSWLTGVNANCFNVNTGCNFDTKDSTSISADNPKQLSTSGGFYGLTGTPTKFIRNVTLTHLTYSDNIPLDDEYLITVRVDWGGNKNYLEVNDLMYNF